MKKLGRLKLKPEKLLKETDLLDYRGGSVGSGSVCLNIQTGYYGYGHDTGCHYYGTLYTDNSCNTLFVPASGTNAILNPPICGSGIWT